MLLASSPSLTDSEDRGSPHYSTSRSILGFTRGEQRLLNCALEGGPDEEIFDRVFISQSVIKKTWRSAYERVDAFGLLDLERLRSAANYFD
jgi:DNA-binding CsgD family transcriptional regulator